MKLSEAKRLVKDRMAGEMAVVSDPYVCVPIHVQYGDIVLCATGWAVCSAEDEFSARRGLGLATSRAINDAAQQIVQIDANARRKAKVAKERAAMDAAIRDLRWALKANNSARRELERAIDGVIKA